MLVLLELRSNLQVAFGAFSNERKEYHILSCLKLAENNHAAPKLGGDWWPTIEWMYPEVGRTLDGCF